MHLRRVICFVIVAFGIACTTFAGSIDLELSGEGVVDQKTVRVGEPVSVDIYVENDSVFTGFTIGFRIVSEDIGSIEHVADSGAGLNQRGDIKGHNGWEDHSVWNFGGVYAVTSNWDSELPDTIGFGGLSVQQDYQPHERKKVLSFEIIVPEEGTVTVDSSFFPPGGKWMFATPDPSTVQFPKFKGPITFKAVKK